METPMSTLKKHQAIQVASESGHLDLHGFLDGCDGRLAGSFFFGTVLLQRGKPQAGLNHGTRGQI